VEGSLDILSVQIGGGQLVQSLGEVSLEGGGPRKGSISQNEILIQVIGVQRGLSSVEGERSNFLVNLSDGAVGVHEKFSAVKRTRGGLAVGADPVVIAFLRDKLVPVEDVHLHISFNKRLTGENGVSEHLSNILLVDLRGRVIQNLSRQSGNVDSTVTLTSKPSWATNKFGVLLQKSFNKVEVVLSSLFVTGVIDGSASWAVGKSNTSRLLKVHNVGIFVPGKLGQLNITSRVDTERTVLSEKTTKSTASGTSLVPEDERVLVGGGA